jgi:fibronectin-binding autotransporter adhesin
MKPSLIKMNPKLKSLKANSSTIAPQIHANASHRQISWSSVLLTAVFAMISNSSAQTLWIDPGTDVWSDSNNWSPNVVPNSSTDVSINNGGTATVTGIASANTLSVGDSGNGNLNITAGSLTVTAHSIVGQGAGTTGTASISGGTWSMGSDLYVGIVGTGSLNISGGAAVSVANDSYIGFGSTSSATVSGGSWTTAGYLVLGYDAGLPAAGTLTITGGEVSAGIVSMAHVSGTTGGIINLNGGVLSTHYLIEQGGSGGGLVNFNGGTLQAKSSQLNFFSGFETGDVQLLAGGGIIDSNGFNISITPVLQGVGGLTKTGAGILTLSSANTYTGQTTVNQGTLHLTAPSNIGRSSLVTVNTGGTLTAAAGFDIGSSATGTEALAIAGGAVSVTGNLQIGNVDDGTFSMTSGSLAVSVHSLVGYDGGTGTATISGGTWSTTGQLLVGAYGNATMTMSGGTVTSAESYIGYGSTATATVSGGTWTTAGDFYIGVDAGAGGAGTLTMNGGQASASVVYLAHNYTGTAAAGTINLNGGVLSTNYLYESTGSGGGNINMNGGTLRAVGNEANFLQNFEAGDVQLLSGGGKIDTSTYNVGIATPIQGVGGLTKLGNGKLTLTGASSYTGTTNVIAGTLIINGDHSAATGNVIVNINTTLGGSGTIGGKTYIYGVHSPGNSPGIQTFKDDLIYTGRSPSVIWELNANTVINQPNPLALFDQIVVEGDLAFQAQTTFDPYFNIAGSNVLWSNSFWDTSQSWLVYDVEGNTTGFGNLTLNTSHLIDSGANSLSAIRSNASFWLSMSGSDVYLNYSNAIPETSTALFAGLGSLILLRRRRDSMNRSK